MNYKLLFSISKTHLLTRKKQSGIAALGVTFGIGTYIIMMGFMNGLNGLLDGLVLNRTPHIRLYSELKPAAHQPIEGVYEFQNMELMVHSIKPKKVQMKIHNALPIMKHLKAQKEILGVSPQVKAQGFYLGGNTQLAALLIGADPIKEKTLYNLNDYIVQGSCEALEKADKGILLGMGAAKKLSLNVGDFVQISSISGEIISLKIVGFYQSGMAEIDNAQSFVNLPIAQLLLGESKDFITDINIKLKNMDKAPLLAKEYAQQFNTTAVDIQTANAQFETGSSIRTLISYAVSITLLIVAGFGIYNILNMLIYEKMNDIAILKATGFSGSDVKWIFISQALIIGVVGGVLGLLFGYVVTLIIDNTPFDTAALPTIKTYPIDYNPKYYIIGMVFSLIATFFAGYFPSRKAQKIDPVDIIRGQ
jgi:lipoprotein-releasing system permease protein